MKETNIDFEYNGKRINLNASVCEGTFSKMLGKMFTFNKKPLLFVFSKEQEVQIHMLFVFMPLIVFWLDENKKLIKAKKMKPFTSFESARAKYILEVPLANLN
jgi:uncharacterized membrane protein (UPF0127 family)